MYVRISARTQGWRSQAYHALQAAASMSHTMMARSRAASMGSRGGPAQNEDRRSVASARPSGALASTAVATQTSASVPKSLRHCPCSPSSCSHHLPANLPNARFVGSGEHGSFSRGLKEGSSWKKCLPAVKECACWPADVVRATSARPLPSRPAK